MTRAAIFPLAFIASLALAGTADADPFAPDVLTEKLQKAQDAANRRSRPAQSQPSLVGD